MNGGICFGDLVEPVSDFSGSRYTIVQLIIVLSLSKMANNNSKFFTSEFGFARQGFLFAGRFHLLQDSPSPEHMQE